MSLIFLTLHYFTMLLPLSLNIAVGTGETGYVVARRVLNSGEGPIYYQLIIISSSAVRPKRNVDS